VQVRRSTGGTHVFPFGEEFAAGRERTTRCGVGSGGGFLLFGAGTYEAANDDDQDSPEKREEKFFVADEDRTPAEVEFADLDDQASKECSGESQDQAPEFAHASRLESGHHTCSGSDEQSDQKPGGDLVRRTVFESGSVEFFPELAGTVGGGLSSVTHSGGGVADDFLGFFSEAGIAG